MDLVKILTFFENFIIEIVNFENFIIEILKFLKILNRNLKILNRNLKILIKFLNNGF
jgi:hypothetical protein